MSVASVNGNTSEEVSILISVESGAALKSPVRTQGSPFLDIYSRSCAEASVLERLPLWSVWVLTNKSNDLLSIGFNTTAVAILGQVL